MVEEGKQGKVHEQLYEHKPQVSEASSHCSLDDCCTHPSDFLCTRALIGVPGPKIKTPEIIIYFKYTFDNLEEKQY